MKILSMGRGRINIDGFIPNIKGKQPKWGKDGKISNQKGAFGRLTKEQRYGFTKSGSAIGYQYADSSSGGNRIDPSGIRESSVRYLA